MTRGGFLSEWSQLTASDIAGVEIVGVFSHFARADEPEQDQNAEQIARFNEMIKALENLGCTKIIKHLANSAATLTNPESTFDMVRNGIAMYGLTPDVGMGSSKDFGLRPAMQLRAALYLVKDVPANTPVGYGATEHTSRDTKLGVVTMGYADGIPRISRGAGVWINGQRAPIIGRVSMDQFVVDLGPDSKAKSGDWVVIFGNGSHGEFTADDWGGASGSINYEIVTRIGPRVPRIYSAHIY
jgi:alanine racemase